MNARSRRRGACLVVCVFLIAAGCTGTPSSQPANTSPTTDGDTPGNETPPDETLPSDDGTAEEVWNVSRTLHPSMAEGHGVAFVVPPTSFFPQDTIVRVHPPDNTTHLRANLTPTPDDGVGEMTLVLYGPDNTSLYPESTDDNDIYHGEGAVRLAVDDPAPGEWTARVWPHGVVLDQTWTLTLTLRGVGEPPNGTVFDVAI